MVVGVNWQRLGMALSYFETKGYTQIEVPWVVPEEIIKATCPEDRWIVTSKIGNLVGSAEQSFIQLEKVGTLRALGRGRRFVACSPCFRNEDTVDELHQKHFMKVELYINTDVSRETLERVVSDSREFYSKFIEESQQKNLSIIEFKDGTFDIELCGIEIGSYGIRHMGDTSWIYATALAEPRFSIALQKLTELRLPNDHF